MIFLFLEALIVFYFEFPKLVRENLFAQKILFDQHDTRIGDDGGASFLTHFYENIL